MYVRERTYARRSYKTYDLALDALLHLAYSDELQYALLNLLKTCHA